MEAIALALSRRYGRRLDPREMVSFDGTYPTPSACTLMGCPGCLPEEAYDSHGARKPEWKNAQPGDWSPTPKPSVPKPSVPKPSVPKPLVPEPPADRPAEAA